MGNDYSDDALPSGLDIEFMDVEADGNDVIEFVVRFGTASVGRLSVYRPFDGTWSDAWVIVDPEGDAIPVAAMAWAIEAARTRL